MHYILTSYKSQDKLSSFGKNKKRIRLEQKKRIGVDGSVDLYYNFPVSKDAFLLGMG